MTIPPFSKQDGSDESPQPSFQSFHFGTNFPPVDSEDVLVAPQSSVGSEYPWRLHLENNVLIEAELKSYTHPKNLTRTMEKESCEGTISY